MGILHRFYCILADFKLHWLNHFLVCCLFWVFSQRKKKKWVIIQQKVYWHVCPSKTLISLGINLSDQSSMGALWTAKGPMILQVVNRVLGILIVVCFVVHYFISILVLQSSWWGRESWLLCLVFLPGVSWLLCGSSSRCHEFVCSLWLWYFLIKLTNFHTHKLALNSRTFQELQRLSYVFSRTTSQWKILIYRLKFPLQKMLDWDTKDISIRNLV